MKTLFTIREKNVNWYKKAQQRELWEMDPTGEEYANLDMDTLERMAFGFARKDITKLSPQQLHIEWTDDLNNAIWEQEQSGLSKEEWARQIDLSDPIEVFYENGVFKLDDGHHRYYASLILGKDLTVIVNRINDKPHKTAVRRALEEGKQVPPEIMRYYGELV